jgi:hypothetical protein
MLSRGAFRKIRSILHPGIPNTAFFPPALPFHKEGYEGTFPESFSNKGPAGIRNRTFY